MKLTKEQQNFLSMVNSSDYPDEVYRYASYEGDWCYLIKRLGTCDIHLTNRCRSLDNKGYISSNSYDTLKVTFKTYELEDAYAERVYFKED